jgi:hypothetical protein
VIYGYQRMPKTNVNAVAFLYFGANNQVLAIVNNTTKTQTVTVSTPSGSRLNGPC